MTALTWQETVHFGRSATQIDRCYKTGALRCPLDKVLGKTPQPDTGATRASQKPGPQHTGLRQAGLVLTAACTQRLTRTLVSHSHTLEGGSLGWGGRGFSKGFRGRVVN